MATKRKGQSRKSQGWVHALVPRRLFAELLFPHEVFTILSKSAFLGGPTEPS